MTTADLAYLYVLELITAVLSLSSAEKPVICDIFHALSDSCMLFAHPSRLHVTSYIVPRLSLAVVITESYLLFISVPPEYDTSYSLPL